MTKIVTLYNHKGGVSKTTTTYHLAHALVEHRNKKVLVVDGDPQCNLTELCLFKEIEELDRLEETGTATQLSGTSVKDALWPRLDGDRPNVDVDSIELVQPEANKELYVFRGDIGLSEAEDRLSYAYSQRMTSDMHQKRNYVAVHDMLRRLGLREKFDVILVDVGPSAGALTRNFFLASDQFFVPVAPDRFNYQAIGSLKQILSKWLFEHQQVVPDFRKLNLNIATQIPEFSGIVMQRFQRYKGEAKQGFKVWIDKIRDRAITDLLPSLIAAGGEGAVDKAALTNPIIVEIPDFASLAPMMFAHGMPIWQLSKQQTGWQGNVWDERHQAMQDFEKLFISLANRVKC